MLESRNYFYQPLSPGGIISIRHSFGDHEPPSVNVHSAEVAVLGEAALELTMEFHDSIELNIAGIEAQTLTAMKWRGMIIEIGSIEVFVPSLAENIEQSAIRCNQASPPSAGKSRVH